MTLKDLYNLATPERIYEIIQDYLLKPAHFRKSYSFEDYLEELEVCPICNEINERDNMTYHVWDIGETEELICEGCRNDEEF